MAEGGERFQSQPKEPAVGARVSGGGTPRVVEGSLVRPAGQAVRVVEAGRSLVPQHGAGQESNWFNHEMPYEELVSNIRTLVERERRKVAQAQATSPESPFTQKDPFNAAEWLGGELRKKALFTVDDADPSLADDLTTAWDALASTRYTAEGGRWREMVRQLLTARVQEMKQTSMTLSPKGVAFLDAMAEVAGIPRRRGEATIDLTPFAPKDTGQEL